MPDIWYDVDTALAEVPVNLVALLDDTDFKTRETGVAYNASGMDLVWNFTTTAGAFTQTAVVPTTGGDYDWTHQGDGIYTIEIPASGGASINNDTEGVGWFTGVADGVLPWRGPTCGFRSAIINDALIDDTSLLTSLDIGQLYESTIAAGGVTSQTEYICDTPITTDDAWIGQTVILNDVSTGDSFVTWVTDVVASTDTIIVNEAPSWTVVATDIVRIESRVHPRYELNDYDPPTRTEATTDKNSILAKLLQYVQLIVRKDSAIATDNATELSAINANEGSGVGAYDNTADSLEARTDATDGVNVTQINGTAVQGDGSEGDKWRA